MDNLVAINKDTVQGLIAKYKIKPDDVKCIICRDNRVIQIVIFSIFIYSLIYLFFRKGTANSFTEVITWISLFCVIYFICDFINYRMVAKRRFKRELWLLKTLLEKEDARQFYKAQGASFSQSFFQQENIKNWRWDFDFTSYMRRMVTSFFIEKFNLAGSKVLELGCADGYFLHTLSSCGSIAYGLDLNMGCLQRIAKNGGLYFCQADIKQVPFKSGLFDAVLFLEVLEHLLSPRAAIAEAERVLKPGGLLFLSTPNVNCVCFNYFLNPLKLSAQILATWFNILSTPKPLINIWRGQYYFHTAFSRREIENFLGKKFRIKNWVTYGIGGGLIGEFLKFRPSMRKMFQQLNDIEQNRKYGENYTQLRKYLRDIEVKYGSWLGKINIYLQKIPLIRLMGTNHFIILEKI